MSEVVSYRRQDQVGVITIDYPPVNALGQAVRQGLLDALRQGLDDDAAEVLLLVCNGRTFVAGADIREFGKTPQAPILPEVIAAYENSPKPIIASLHGTTLGGGLELAMSCHYRVALPGAQVGLPEVKLGLLPGAGGTQRLPRLVGARKALEMITTGQFVKADDALDVGIIDAIGTAADSLGNGLTHAAKAIAESWPVRKVSERRNKLEADRGSVVFDEFRTQLKKTSPNLFSPFKCVDAVEAAFELPLERGLQRERELFMECMQSPQRAGLVHVFFSEREASKVPGLSADTPVREINKVAVIGAGTMGQGIAMALAEAGYPVILLETGDDRLEHGMDTISRLYQAQVREGRVTADVVARRMALITLTLGYDQVADCDLVIEAVFENLDAKKAVFAHLDKVCKPTAILATNTSTLNIDQIASATRRPENVIGLHFFSPANIMRLLEVVRGAKTSDTVKATAMAVGKKLKKVAVMVGNGYGFVGNRMLMARDIEAIALVNEGASPSQVDKALTDFGFPMGHFAMVDMSGLDILVAARNVLRGTGATVPPNWTDELVRLGWLGQKTGRGVYRYAEGDRKPQDNPGTDLLIADIRKLAGTTPRAVSGQEILERCMYAMVNEGAKILGEGIAARALEIDTIWTCGYGFPAYRGGPMFWAGQQGLAKVLEGVEKYAKQTGAEHWRVAPLLKKLVEEGKTFD
ncbi:MAG: enoyl-CoA hydratase/isomerase family protein [Xanthomonadaceae bacterium]|jgi:3-hydroxyacyl-CoA dehydrogenase|nr:enoyl-CoA hydratase/isomerase family protein [Xanthomonadaceae bacterium]